MVLRQGLTIDVEIVIGTNTWGTQLTRVLGGSIDGSATITNEAIVGTPDEEASVHDVSQTFNFTNLYQGDETDVLMAHVGETPYCMVIEPTAALRSFEAGEVNLMSLPDNQPPSDVISTSLTLPEAAEHFYGTGNDSVRSFTLEDPAGSRTKNLPSFAKADALFVVLTYADSLTQVTITSGANTHNIAITTAGIVKVELPAAFPATVANGTISVAAGQSATGYFCAGNIQTAPTG